MLVLRNLLFLQSVLKQAARKFMPNQYETTIIATPVLTESELKKMTDEYVKYLKSNDAEIIHEEHWGLRQLAYPIKKKTTGFYFTVEYKAPTDLLGKFELNLKRDDNIMRFLTVSLGKYAIEYNEKKRAGLIGRNKKKGAEGKEEDTESKDQKEKAEA